MQHTQYFINKFRFGWDSRWDPNWVYEAASKNVNNQEVDNAKRGTSKRHSSLDSLARELATFPGISKAEFFSLNYEGGPRVSLGNGKLTQSAVITDNELGELGALVQKYCRKIFWTMGKDF